MKKIQNFDASTYMDCASAVMDVEITDECRAGVILNLQRNEAIARLVMEFPLDDEAVPAAIFEP